MKKPKFVKNNVYHIYNRGVEKRDIFLEKLDYLRLIHDLFEFNDENPAPPSNIRFSSRFPSQVASSRIEKCLEVEPPNIVKGLGGIEKMEPRKLLVEILAFSLMPNHFHLLLREIKEGGIVRFMQKLGTGYTMFFNQKYERVGPLFQGRFKASLVDREDYLQYLLYYIHFNCLDLIESTWREGKIKNYSEAFKFLNTYRWSSHLDYVGQKNFPSLTQRSFLIKIIGGVKGYKKITEDWIKEISVKMKEEELRSMRLE